MAGVPRPDTWQGGDPYERYMGRWSRRIAPLFVHWLDVPPGRRWLDVGCGTGALSRAILDVASPAAVFAVDPSPGLLATASANVGDPVTLSVGSADEIPLDAASVDVTVSGLVLNFTPNMAMALAEQSRVTAPGGPVAAYVWDYDDGFELLRLFWDAATELQPGAADLDEGVRFLHCRPDALRSAFVEAGFGDVVVAPIEVVTEFVDFDDLWTPFLGGQGPAPSYVTSLDDEARTALRDSLRERVPVGEDGSIALRARAWAIRGQSGR